MTLLCFAPVDIKKYNKLLENHTLNNYRKRLIKIVSSFSDFKYLEMNLKDYAKTKKEILKKIKSQ